MREILFRGQEVQNGLWVVGFYVHVPCGRFLCDEHMIQTVEEDGRIGQLYNVYERTVGQFTGLTDNNGVKIFEGDIIQYMDSDEKPTAVIMFGQHRDMEVGFYAEWGESQPCLRQDLAFWTTQREVEVIGNIHDNPKIVED